MRTPGKGKRTGSGVDASERTIRLALTAAAFASLVAGLSGPSNWRWGMNLLRYFPPPFALALFVAALVLIWLVPLLDDNAPLARLVAGGKPWLTGLVSSVGALTLFIFFRTRSLLLGDGLELVRRLHQGEVPAPRSPLFNAIEPVFYRWLEGGESARGGESAAAISFVAGFVAVAVTVFFLARIARRIPAAALTAAALLLTCGGMQLFFGYVEVYPILATATLLFFSAAFDRLTGGGMFPFVAANIGMGVALLCHPFGTTLLPAWLYLVSGSGAGDGWSFRLRRALLIVGSGVAAVLLMVIAFALNPAWSRPGASFRYLSPMVQIEGLIKGLNLFNHTVSWAPANSVFSLVHAADCWNTLWLSGAAGFAFVIGALVTPAGRHALRRPVVRVALLGFGMICLYRFIWRTPLGALRDWDLYAGLGFGITVIAAAFSLAGVGRRLAPPVLGAALIFLVPWIGIQVDPDRAARRHFDGVDAEPRPEPMVAAQFHGAMGDRFSSLRNFDLAAAAYQRALALRPRHEYAWRLGMAYFAAKKYDKAIPPLEQALALRPDDRTTIITLAEVWIDSGHPEKADPWIAKALALYPEAGSAWLQKGRAAMSRGNKAEAEAAFAQADRYLSKHDGARRDLERARQGLASIPDPVKMP